MKSKFVLLLAVVMIAGCGKARQRSLFFSPPINADIIMDGQTVAVMTNVVEIVPLHEANCHLVRYIHKGSTSEFHAFMAEVRDASTHKVICAGPTREETEAMMKEVKEAVGKLSQ